MDEIISNLVDPSWWFTGIFFVALFKFLPVVFSHITHRTKRYFRGRRLIRALFIRSNRHNLAAVNFHSIKSQAYFVVFMLVCALYLILFVGGPLFQLRQSNLLVFILFMIPMAIAQCFWMLQEDKAKELVSEYNKVRSGLESRKRS